jgi:hypothetical protein
MRVQGSLPQMPVSHRRYLNLRNGSRVSTFKASESGGAKSLACTAPKRFQKSLVDDEKARSTEHERNVPESLTVYNIIIRSRTIYRQVAIDANNL